MSNLDILTAQVTENISVEQSAIQLLANLSAALIAAKNNPVAVQALADQLKSSDQALASAITANTPAA